MNSTTFENKTVIVTGGAQGIGAAIVTAYANNGASVVIVDIKDEKGLEVKNKLELEGKEAHFIKCDISKPEQVESMVKKVFEKFGTVDILINNAGISISKPVFELSIDDWDTIINTNLRGAFLCAKEAAGYMKKNGGKIINIASTRAFMSEKGWEAYASSKGGLVALTHALALSLGEFNIQVNCISPGWIMTHDYGQLRPEDHYQHPSGRVGKPEDIARACLFLTDPHNSFITGENVIIDGGMTKKMIYQE